MDPPGTYVQPAFLLQAPVQPKKVLPWGCAICDKKEDLKTCTDCGVLSYCSREHQAQHRRENKEICNDVKQTQATVAVIDAQLGPHPSDPSLPNLSRLGTVRRDERFPADAKTYFPAIFNLTDCMERLYTKKSVREGIALSKLMMPYYHDKLLSGGLVSTLWIRLDEDQEVYGFIKAWTIWEESENHSPGQIAPTPIKNADILEDVDLWLNIEVRFMDMTDSITFLLTLTLLKIKILLDLKDLHNARQAAGPNVPEEVLKNIMANIPRSSAIKANRRIMSARDLSPVIAELDSQVDALYKKIYQTNLYWWRLLANPPLDIIQSVVGRYNTDPMSAGCGSPIEAASWITRRGQRFCWIETPGALDFIREKNANFPLPALESTYRAYGKRAEDLLAVFYASQ
ncbi:uncharacterized protein N7483_001192 [Penicillium malachiteum]|uniref:uncharacterized protein n=1 Tax=Penicillium malachiteum TaxID=1324776 RepID=UPI002548F757|nr:uncharacterized protein N7483_001192 [Penicillium malachiteum]KAJ5736067.1 hypothetical protein N7483_001192 [Penicillium malachiteum]